ncbi:MAG: Gfo/Idh/MocA family oxidoreductase [Bacteroidia bacterium]|nr:Gfo/Idh/MocA family oxidoreductase [Bacteroidia bacterium]
MEPHSNEPLNRRHFTKKLAGGLGAFALTTSTIGLGALDACAQASGEKLGIALVGLGNYATNQLAPALQETKNCYLAAIVTGTPEKAEKWKAKYNIPDKNIYNYDNFDDIKDNPDIDLVYVVLPNSMHMEYSIRAAKAGKDVISEKPMATNLADAERMVREIKKTGQNLYIGYRLHYEPYNLEAARIGTEGDFGKVKVFEGSFGFKIGDPTQWRLNKELAGGGPLMDVGIYVIQAARYCTGEEPIAITAQEYKTDPVKFAQVDETIFWQMEFPSGAVANCSTTYASNIQRLFLSCENGYVDLSPVYGYGGIGGKTHKKTLELPAVNQQALHMDGIAYSIIHGTKANNVSGAEGLRDMQVIDAIYRAIESKGRIEIG